jgi:hypothetical protein
MWNREVKSKRMRDIVEFSTHLLDNRLSFSSSPTGISMDEKSDREKRAVNFEKRAIPLFMRAMGIFTIVMIFLHYTSRLRRIENRVFINSDPSDWVGSSELGIVACIFLVVGLFLIAGPRR